MTVARTSAEGAGQPSAGERRRRDPGAFFTLGVTSDRSEPFHHRRSSATMPMEASDSVRSGEVRPQGLEP